jgi:hypothetical protein
LSVITPVITDARPLPSCENCSIIYNNVSWITKQSLFSLKQTPDLL